MLLIPGSVQSHIIDKQSFQLAPGLMYAGYLHNILQRLQAAKGGAMPTEQFVEDAVSKARATNPLSHVRSGGRWLFAVLGLLPRTGC